jgi:hypothetical protein
MAMMTPIASVQRIADIVHHDRSQHHQQRIVGVAGIGVDHIHRHVASAEQIAHQLHGIGTGHARVYRSMIVVIQPADGQIV